jgi:hypothetical protein
MNSNLQWGDEMILDDEKKVVTQLNDCFNDDGFIQVNKQKNRKAKEDVRLKDVRLKKVVCKSVKDGVPCSYHDRCTFIHYLDEADPNLCNFGYDCNKTKFSKDNKIRNTSNKNPCYLIHPNETISGYMIRIGVKSSMERPKQEEIYKNTRMCHSTIKGVKCDEEENCTYAHKPEDLKLSKCGFGINCFHIVTCDDVHYVNKEYTGKVCMFLHENETIDNYIERVINNKKRKAAILEKDEIAKRKRIDTTIKEPEVKDLIYICAPSSIANDVLDVMIKNGKTNIQMSIY